MNKDVFHRIPMIFFTSFFFVLTLFSASSHALNFIVTPKVGTTLPTSVPSGGTVYAYYTVSNNTMIERDQNYIQNLPANVAQITTGGFYADTCAEAFDLTASGTSGSSCTLQLIISGAVAGMPNPFVCFVGSTNCNGTTSPLIVSVSTAPQFSWLDTGLSGAVYVSDLAVTNGTLYAGGLAVPAIPALR